ncbi:hypothetical protein [Methyloversatilis sp. RAC08]|uniref:hypothetical protein n=1 Tax=Methyloversatilis sp. RAC08 TaxID=1842540 RepID=UPI00123763EF|nr:hypothetical protein [Methyloversatilis sp. RAC08]
MMRMTVLLLRRAGRRRLRGAVGRRHAVIVRWRTFGRRWMTRMRVIDRRAHRLIGICRMCMCADLSADPVVGVTP